jgi:hypothetical protein
VILSLQKGKIDGKHNDLEKLKTQFSSIINQMELITAKTTSASLVHSKFMEAAKLTNMLKCLFAIAIEIKELIVLLLAELDD